MSTLSSTNTLTERINQSALVEFSSDSPIWIYPSNRVFDEVEKVRLQASIDDFTTSWLSHGQRVQPFGKLFFSRFVVLSADSNFTLPSGCSIDSSVHFIKGIESQYDVNFFDRMLVSWIKDDREIISASYHELPSLIEQGHFNRESLIFDMTVKSVGEFRDAWIKPAANSWLARTLF